MHVAIIDLDQVLPSHSEYTNFFTLHALVINLDLVLHTIIL